MPWTPSDAERTDALEHLDLAIAELRDMHMQPGLERALRLMEHASTALATAPHTPAYPDGLSQREVEVLRLIAAGKSNQAIADDLVISLNTVMRHITNLFAKIGTANRTEAANYAHRHGLA